MAERENREELIERARRMLDRGSNIKQVAEALGIPRASIYKMLGLGVSRRDDENARTLEEYLEEREKYAAQFEDPNVVLLGDPPYYRSALARKRRENGEQP